MRNKKTMQIETRHIVVICQSQETPMHSGEENTHRIRNIMGEKLDFG